MEIKCVNCKGSSFVDSKSYEGAAECADCGFLANKNQVNTKTNIIMPEDPMDALMCESCQ